VVEFYYHPYPLLTTTLKAVPPWKGGIGGRKPNDVSQQQTAVETASERLAEQYDAARDYSLVALAWERAWLQIQVTIEYRKLYRRLLLPREEACHRDRRFTAYRERI